MTGSVSRQMSINAVHSVLRMLRKVFPYLIFRSNGYRIQNIVCSVSVPRLQCINVEQMYKEFAAHTTYQPCIFPGLIYRSHAWLARLSAHLLAQITDCRCEPGQRTHRLCF